MTDSSLIWKTATEIRNLLARGEVTPLDLLDALEARISAVEPRINALPTLCFERARDHAKALMEKPVADRGELLGIPVAIKDLEEVKGVRTTFGSPIFADHIPTKSDIVVETLEKNGGVVYAKANTPEFGAGGNTFNEVLGTTLNPWNQKRSVAGSSGGSAAALASGTAWLAQGSDTGGSLRNPASFCSIVGLRPSPGRVARGPSATPFANLPVAGPMARNVADVALMLDAMSGEHPRDPISLARPAESFVDAVNAQRLPKRVAFSRDLGCTPVDPEVAKICEAAALKFEALGVKVEEAHPDFHDVQEIFQALRAEGFYMTKKKLLDAHRDKMKPEVVWNIEKALEYSLEDFTRVQLARGAYIQRAVDFFETYDLLLSPATCVGPYPVEQRYVEVCDGHTFDNYVEWLTMAYAITLTTFPALSIPAGFTAEGLPVGLQVVGGPRDEAGLLSAAALLEAEIGHAAAVPIDPV
ncbi:MAG: amidase [Nisaea sp.]|uniref:amidase n=1 Tax=Nisaea sp. TaxID=2024842 RepID=UPI001B091FAF|nr:amidase family protein [Nisaea sp.]MBO6561588.1 amidase [Nisaea sp.]